MRIKLMDEDSAYVWHTKFIWWPRIIESHLVWLETAQRRAVHYSNLWCYQSTWEYALYDPPKIEYSGYEGIG